MAENERVVLDEEETYEGYVVRWRCGQTDDGRFSWCWGHVYADEAAQGRDERTAALDLRGQHPFDWSNVADQDAAKRAIALSRRWLYRQISEGQLEHGTLYRVTVDADGRYTTEPEPLPG